MEGRQSGDLLPLISRRRIHEVRRSALHIAAALKAAHHRFFLQSVLAPTFSDHFNGSNRFGRARRQWNQLRAFEEVAQFVHRLK
jgi:hypothetical protein